MIERIRNENFDIALRSAFYIVSLILLCFCAHFSENFDSCGFAIFRLAGIEKTIVLYASTMPLDDATYFGVPATPSFIPVCDVEIKFARSKSSILRD